MTVKDILESKMVPPIKFALIFVAPIAGMAPHFILSVRKLAQERLPGTSADSITSM
jgi:hypothetical protein